jgi:hypothetical protein
MGANRQPFGAYEKSNYAAQAKAVLMHKTYEFVSQLPAQTALERIEGLLSKEGVEYKADNLSIASVRTPFALLSFDRKLYSSTDHRSNWTGLNPFIYISGVVVRCEEVDRVFTKVTVRINRLRTFLWVAFWIACSLLAASAMPEPGGAIQVIGVACAAWFGIVSFLGGYLIKKEIADSLTN